MTNLRLQRCANVNALSFRNSEIARHSVYNGSYKSPLFLNPRPARRLRQVCGLRGTVPARPRRVLGRFRGRVVPSCHLPMPAALTIATMPASIASSRASVGPPGARRRIEAGAFANAAHRTPLDTFRQSVAVGQVQQCLDVSGRPNKAGFFFRVNDHWFRIARSVNLDLRRE